MNDLNWIRVWKPECPEEDFKEIQWADMTRVYRKIGRNPENIQPTELCTLGQVEKYCGKA